MWGSSHFVLRLSARNISQAPRYHLICDEYVFIFAMSETVVRQSAFVKRRPVGAITGSHPRVRSPRKQLLSTGRCQWGTHRWRGGPSRRNHPLWNGHTNVSHDTYARTHSSRTWRRLAHGRDALSGGRAVGRAVAADASGQRVGAVLQRGAAQGRVVVVVAVAINVTGVASTGGALRRRRRKNASHDKLPGFRGGGSQAGRQCAKDQVCRFPNGIKICTWQAPEPVTHFPRQVNDSPTDASAAMARRQKRAEKARMTA